MTKDVNFDTTSVYYWFGETEKNEWYLSSVNQYFKDRLRGDDWISLNDVLERLGIPRTMEGQKIGWFGSENPEDLFTYQSYIGGFVISFKDLVNLF